MNRRRIGPVVALGLVLASGCGYHVPHPAERIGMHTFTADVLYGAAAAAVLPGAVPLPLPAPPVPVNGGGFSTPTRPVAPPPTTAAAFVCSPAHSATVTEPTISRVLAPPVAATYPFRADIKATSASAGAHALTNVAETRQISNVVTSGNTINYTVTTTYPFLATIETTDYQIVTSSDVPADNEGSVPLGTLSGIYVTGQSVATIGSKKPANTVTWSPPLQILKLPAATSETWAVHSTDQKTGESESFTAKIDAISQVNACGTLVQGFHVVLSGALVTPGSGAPLTFTQTDLIAPQFGGLVLADDATVTAQPTGSTQQISDTINVSPELPRSSS